MDFSYTFKASQFTKLRNIIHWKTELDWKHISTYGKVGNMNDNFSNIVRENINLFKIFMPSS